MTAKTGLATRPQTQEVRDLQRMCEGTAAESLAKRSEVRQCSESHRDLAFELWKKKEAFQSYRFGEISI